MVKLDVFCPETGNPERIHCIVDKDKEVLVVLRCTRFDPPTNIQCCESCREVLNGRLDGAHLPNG